MKKLIYSVAFTVGIIGLHAQETTTVSGGESFGEGGSVSYSIGQVVSETHVGTTGRISEGVHQPFEIYVVTGMKKSGIDLQISAYPNPVSDHLILKVDDNSYVTQGRMIATLINISGSIVKQEMIIDPETTIDMSQQKSGTYFLRILMEDQEIKAFKIILN